ncbi:MAG: hypothetical protein ACAH83_20180 [Alphaproteobacteria bacterium]
MDGLEKLLYGSLALVFAGVATVGALSFPYRDPQGARDALENTATLKNVQILDGRDWMGRCGGDYLFRTKFKATNDKGEQVQGLVCRDLFRSQVTVVYRK